VFRVFRGFTFASSPRFALALLAFFTFSAFGLQFQLLLLWRFPFSAFYFPNFSFCLPAHSSTAVHQAYAKKAIIIAPSLEDYENKVKSPLPPPSPSVAA
jgi:hypothetical protein